MQWKKADGGAVVSGPFVVKVAGEDAGGRANVWSLDYEGQPVKAMVRGKPMTKVFDRQRDAKSYALSMWHKIRRWESEARSHGHAPTYYNDSECRGCVLLRGSDESFSAWVHQHVNLKQSTEVVS